MMQVCPKKKRNISEKVEIFSRNQIPHCCCPLDVDAIGLMLVVSSTTTQKTSSSGSTKRIRCASSPWKKETTSQLSSPDSQMLPKLSKLPSREMDTISCITIIWVSSCPVLP